MCIPIMGCRTKHLERVPEYTQTLIEVSAACSGKGHGGEIKERNVYISQLDLREKKKLKEQDWA